MATPLRALAPTSATEGLPEVSPGRQHVAALGAFEEVPGSFSATANTPGRFVDVSSPAAIPFNLAGFRLSALHPAFSDPMTVGGVSVRPQPQLQRVRPLEAVAAVPNGEHPELTSSVLNRFLGTSRHDIDAKSERSLNDDETRRLRILLGTKNRIDSKTVPPNWDDQRLLQRMLNITLGSALSSPLVVDGDIGSATKSALQLYRRTRGLPATVNNGALVDRDMLVQLGREATAARATPSTRVPAFDPEANASQRSVRGMLDLLSREDPVRYNALLRAVGITGTRMLTNDDLQKVIDAGSKHDLTFDDDTATRLQLSQPGAGAPMPWNYEATRVAAAFISGEMTPNRGMAGLGQYRSWAQRADHAGLVMPRVLEIDALVESSYNPRLTSSAKARGLHQLTRDVTARYGGLDPFNPVLNIGMARRELSRVYDEQLRRLRAIDDSYARRYPDESSMPQRDTDRNDGSVWRMAWAANNSGPRRLLRYQGVPPFDETQRHVMFLAWYNATLPDETEVPPVVSFAPPRSVGPQGPEDFTRRRVSKQF